MADTRREFLDKAREALLGAESELANRRYNNAANRAYYACFLAAIAALMHDGIRAEKWEHDFVQARFSGVLIRQRKLYPAHVARYLPDNFDIRRQGDYKPTEVSRSQAQQAVARAKEFVRLVEHRVEEKE